MIWVLIVILLILLYVKNSENKTNAGKESSQKIVENFINFESHLSSEHNIAFLKPDVNYLELLESKAKRDCKEDMDDFLKTERPGIKLKNFLEEYRRRSDLYFNIIKNKKHVSIYKIYAIKRWLIVCESDSFKDAYKTVNHFLDTCKFLENPEAVKSSIDNILDLFKDE